jgi:hypothetical protein
VTNEKRVEEIRERLAKATPGPWECYEGGTPGFEFIALRGPSPFDAFPGQHETFASLLWPGHSAEELKAAEDLTLNTGKMIAAAPSDISFLLSELDRARKALKKIAEDPGLREPLATVRFMIATAKAAYDAPTENK